MSSLEELVRGSRWANSLTAAEFDRLRKETYERRIPAGGLVVRAGDPAEFWGGIIEGLAKMSVSMPDGRVSTFTGITAGGWFGEGTLLKSGIWRYDGVALRDTRVACVPRASFERLVSTSLPFNRALLSLLNARLSLFIGLVEFDRLLGPDARVARCLASLFDPDLYPQTGNFIQLSQDEIGLLSAVSRQRANEALRGLQKEGLLRIEFRGVTVLDLAGLRAYSGVADCRHGLKTRALAGDRGASLHRAEKVSA